MLLEALQLSGKEILINRDRLLKMKTAKIAESVGVQWVIFINSHDAIICHVFTPLIRQFFGLPFYD